MEFIIFSACSDGVEDLIVSTGGYVNFGGLVFTRGQVSSLSLYVYLVLYF